VNEDAEEPPPEPGRKPVDITVPVLVALGVLLLVVGLVYWRGAIPRPLAAASTAALALIVVLLAVSIVELIDSQLVVGWTSDHLPDWWRAPGIPLAALAFGVLIGYFFW
jgi:hypothetical protein